MVKRSLSYYINRHAQGQLTSEERDILVAMLHDSAYQEELVRLLDSEWPFWEELGLDLPQSYKQVKKGVLQQIRLLDNKTTSSVHRIHFLRRNWFRYAAAILILSGMGSYFFMIRTKEKSVVNQKVSVEDILPGTNKALLTLSDGTSIVLDSAADGTIAQQGNSSIVKLSNGEIRYDLKGLSQGDILMNTMATPRGGQYQLVLPDGTKVWLNAASSITYPAVFVGSNRKIKITGEVYLEVADDKSKPFLVDIDGKASVEVLGTNFNVNSYIDEGEIKTTLIEGCIKVNSQFILKPGQQAVQPEGKVKMIDNVNIDQVIAWKNGLFSFNSTDIYTVMRQLSRWYNIDVKYDDKVPTVKISGKMDRGLSLQEILEFLTKMEIKCRMEGRTLIVTG